MKSNIPLIWVETRRNPSKYLKNNLKIHHEIFPDRRIVIIVSEQNKAI